MGDAVISLSTLQYLKESCPNQILYFGVPAWIAPLFDNVNIAADQVIPMNFKSIKDWSGNIRQLRKYRIKRIHELFLRGSSHKFFSFFSFLVGGKYTFHNHHLNKSSQIKDQGIIKSNIQRDLDGVASLITNQKSPEYLLYPPKMTLKSPVEKNNSVILGIVATRETKQWDIENFVEVAKILKESGIKTRIPISPNELDQKLKREFVERGGEQLSEFIEVSLSDLPIELAKSSYYIGNDTGIKHICVSLGLKTVTLFGPEPPLEWHPYDTTFHPYLFLDPLECRTVSAHYCGLGQCDSMICLKSFTPEAVINTFKPLL